MKEIALIGANGTVMSYVLTSLLENGLSVNALTLFPEKVMLNNSRLTVSRLDVASKEHTREALEGYNTVVIANETNLTNKELNEIVLKTYNQTVNAAIEAGVERLIVVGGPESSAFYLGDLKRHNEIDWVFTTTEGDFARRVSDEVISPRYHREVIEC